MLGLVVREEDDKEEERGRRDDDDDAEWLRLRRSVVEGDADPDAEAAARRAAERVTRTLLEDDEELLIDERLNES